MAIGAIILPNQLFAKSPLLSVASQFYLLEHEQFFLRHRYHKKKLLLHRASMKAYERTLRERGLRVDYVDCGQGQKLTQLADRLRRRNIEQLCILDPVDTRIVTEIGQLRKVSGLDVNILDTPQFLTDRRGTGELLGSAHRYRMATFYPSQRIRLRVLVQESRPVGGKWSFDVQNRQRLPSAVRVPALPSVPMTELTREAMGYVEKHFGNNPGTTEGWLCPTTYDGALAWLTDFIEHRLASFGPYEDAISKNRGTLFHSVLSPLLNTGLLTPDEVVNRVVEYAERHDVGLASLEGFVRQVIGWREFVRGVYVAIGEQQREGNFWGLSNPLPRSFYDGSTGVEPVDTIIHRVLRNAYAQHIERLMILGNFMLLCEIRPDEVYRWFMELFIDAYDWVMVANVYGMSQYADGGRITTKPYISSSNYLRKMSDFRGGDWCDIWDGLFWRFVSKHKRAFAANARMRVMAVQVDRMDRGRLKAHIGTAERFLATLFE
jgi:deoxyribodipyrimidine photolyase-related protein